MWRASILVFAGAVIAWDPLYSAEPRKLPYEIRTSSEKIPGSKLQKLTAGALYPYVVPDVWDVVTRFGEYEHFVPYVKGSRLEKTEGPVSIVYLRMSLPWPLPDFWNRLEVRSADTKDRLTWRLLDGNMKTNEGSLTLESKDKSTAAEMEARVDLGFWIPQWVVGWAAQKAFPVILRRFGRYTGTQVRAKARAQRLAPPTPTPTPNAQINRGS